MDLTELENLSTEELKDLSDKIDFVLTKKLKDSYDAEMLYDILSNSLYRKLRFKTIPYFRFKENFKSTNVGRTILFLNNYLSDLISEKITRNLKANFYKVYAEVMTEYIKKKGYELNIFTLITYYNSFPSALYDAYPGYAENNAFDLIINIPDSV